MFVAILFSSLPSWAQAPVPPEFSADFRVFSGGGTTDQGKFYMGNKKVRMEMTGARQTQIHRLDKDVAWIFLGDTKSYMEMPLQFNALVNTKWPGFSENCLGDEVIDGHPCKKCQVTGRFMGQSVTSTIWKAQDLGGVVIRNVGDNGSGMELKGVVIGSQPAGLFEPPAGYQKMTMPVGLGDIMKEMAK